MELLTPRCSYTERLHVGSLVLEARNYYRYYSALYTSILIFSASSKIVKFTVITSKVANF